MSSLGSIVTATTSTLLGVNTTYTPPSARYNQWVQSSTKYVESLVKGRSELVARSAALGTAFLHTAVSIFACPAVLALEVTQTTAHQYLSRDLLHGRILPFYSLGDGLAAGARFVFGGIGHLLGELGQTAYGLATGSSELETLMPFEQTYRLTSLLCGVYMLGRSVHGLNRGMVASFKDPIRIELPQWTRLSNWGEALNRLGPLPAVSADGIAILGNPAFALPRPSAALLTPICLSVGVATASNPTGLATSSRPQATMSPDLARLLEEAMNKETRDWAQEALQENRETILETAQKKLDIAQRAKINLSPENALKAAMGEILKPLELDRQHAAYKEMVGRYPATSSTKPADLTEFAKPKNRTNGSPQFRGVGIAQEFAALETGGFSPTAVIRSAKGTLYRIESIAKDCCLTLKELGNDAAPIIKRYPTALEREQWTVVTTTQ